jgi:trigger factor
MKVIEGKPQDGIVKLECEATAQEVNNALRDAAQAFAVSVGIRPKPGQTLEEAAKEQMGITDLDSIVYMNAIELLVPRALDRRNLMPAFPPKATPTTKFERGKRFGFEMKVTLKPKYELTSYEPVDIKVEPFVFDESVIDTELENVARGALTYVDADPKPLEKGDACSVAMTCFDGEEEIKALTCEDRTYIIGVGMMPEGFDENLIGMQPGDTKEFTFDAPMGTDENGVVMSPIKTTVTINKVQKELIPAITDEWVRENMGPRYATVEALRTDMRRVFEAQQREAYNGYVQQMAVAALSKRFEGRIADEMYEATRDQLVQNLQIEVQQSGMNWEQFVQKNGGEQQFGMMLMMQTREILVQGYCLDAVFRHNRLSLTDQDLTNACAGMNPQANPAAVRQELEASGRGFALRETAERMKAAQYVVDKANITYMDAPHIEREEQAEAGAAQEATADKAAQAVEAQPEQDEAEKSAE